MTTTQMDELSQDLLKMALKMRNQANKLSDEGHQTLANKLERHATILGEASGVLTAWTSELIADPS